ncbi:hypothetical protein [Candidatus Bartonella washoeensis]|uniref:hypothetical protein n=1 Tax=Candidatus Bartonella washoeensis TaxID=186739 RepID=UPI0011BD0CD9|nr:hypothetical protein [Bartonella washoeensis]
MTSKNISRKKLKGIYKSREKKKRPHLIQLKQLQRASDAVGNQSVTVIADCLPRRTVHYAVTEQEINLLKDHATSACRCHGIMGTLFGTLLTLLIQLCWDQSHLEIKLALIIIISIVLGFLLFYSLKFMSKAEEIWQNIKQESGDIGEKKQKEGTP